MKKFIRAFFFSNIFLGFCAVVLCVETNLLNDISLNFFPFYLLIFLCTVIYYTMIYVRSVQTKNYNERTIWYRTNLPVIKTTLKVAIVVTIVLLLYLFFKNFHALVLLFPWHFLLIISFPVIAGWYTFAPPIFSITKIRQIGWMKPFIVGLTWAGWVTVYPVFIGQVQKNQLGDLQMISLLLLWLQNFLFFSVNAIIFDIKDYRTDSRHRLKTYPVIIGIRNTFRFIVIPVFILSVLAFFMFQWQQHFSLLQTLVQLVPYLLMVVIIARYRHGRGVLYYLAAVDGLVFLKAICGITSILFIKK